MISSPARWARAGRRMPEPGRPAISRRVPLIVGMAWFMQNLDTSIIVTSLPQLAQTFGVDSVSVNLGITANVVAAAAFIPLGGWLTDRCGAKRVLVAAILLFGLASLGCAASTELWQFVLARVAQGLAGALMVPVGRLVVLRNTDKAGLLKATAMITWPGLIAPVIAPVVGGALTTWYGWQWIFLPNVPLAVLGAVLVLLFVPNHRGSDPKPFDLVGTVLIVSALGLMIYGMSELARPSALALDITLLAAGVALGATAVRWFRRSAHPLIDLGPLRIATFVIAVVSAGNILRIAISATPFLLPLMFQEVWGLSPLDAGKIILVYAVGNLVMKTITTPLLRLLGFRTTLVANGVIVALAIGACGFLTKDTSSVVVSVVAFAAGAARSIQFTGLNTLAFADTDADTQASASTFFSMMQKVSEALGVGAAAIVLATAAAVGSGPLTQADFGLAFALSAVVALLGAGLLLRLRPDAGRAVTGHQHRRDQ